MFLSRRAADLSLSNDQYYATETKCRLNQHKNISAADKNTQQIMNSFLPMRKLDKGCSLIENEGCRLKNQRQGNSIFKKTFTASEGCFTCVMRSWNEYWGCTVFQFFTWLLIDSQIGLLAIHKPRKVAGEWLREKSADSCVFSLVFKSGKPTFCCQSSLSCTERSKGFSQ